MKPIAATSTILNSPSPARVTESIEKSFLKPSTGLIRSGWKRNCRGAKTQPL